MQNRKQLDYQSLRELAESRGIRFVEAQGLDMRKGVRFNKNGDDWIAVDSDLPEKEKIRALGFLLEKEPKSIASKSGILRGTDLASKTPVLTLYCS